MNNTLQFLGAAENVTGSRYLLECDGTKILVDCGLYQEREFQGRNWEDFGFEPGSVDAMLLTHAHLDHCGLIPRLVKKGFSGRIYCTPATAELAGIVLLDAGKLQEEDAESKLKRHKKEDRQAAHPVEPLYTAADAESSLRLFSPVEFKKTFSIGPVQATFYEAGHILGASIIRLDCGFDGRKRTIIFTGDLGSINKPIIRDPAVFEQADYLLVESTYGDRDHQSAADTKEQLARVVNRAWSAGGNIIIPSFSIERSQEVLYYLNELLTEDRIPHIMTFLDSPMAIKATEVFERHPELYDRDMRAFMSHNESPFSFRGLTKVQSTRQSKAINHIRGTIIIIAGSGMCTGGRIKHHLVNNISRPESTIVFVGYQAAGTLGRQILDGRSEVRILGQMYPVYAGIERVHGFSGHADRGQILKWLSNFKKAPKRIFLVHGEKDSTAKFRDYLSEHTGWDIAVAKYRQQVEIV